MAKVYCGKCQHYKEYMFYGKMSEGWLRANGCMEPQNVEVEESDDFERHHERPYAKEKAAVINKYNNCGRFKALEVRNGKASDEES
ncbi:hypothetical protein LCGC14_1956600 [marine sediment metagenome]|uniref:Uncharacterized protein n=1 Tax=marine sediment metagenome TaxID=412755 RepID=A0A0F9FFW7_9ZZZZ